MRRNIALLALMATCFSCGDETSIMLTIDGDLRLGVDVEMLEVNISDASGPVRSQTYDLRSRDPWPHTLLILPGSQVTGVISIEVRALIDGDETLSATRRSQFESDQQVAEEICLYRRCIGSTSRSCEEGLCRPETDGDADADDDGDADGDGDFDDDTDGDDDVDVCEPRCGARECGPDPFCDVSCGGCDANQDCNASGLCECRFEECDGACCAMSETCSALDGSCCLADCGLRECGLDPACGLLNCGGCEDLEDCNDEGMCECLYAECADGCCLDGESCSRAGVCCLPDCGDRRCGMDPLCGSMSCGDCPEHAGCNALGLCECRFVDCDGTCCAEGQVCSSEGLCCDADCGERVCGMDPVCGVVGCGSCGANQTCTEDGTCECSHVECESVCCAAGEECIDGACCLPDCGDRDCGMDPVCGTLACGECSDLAECDETGHCDCLFEPCGDDCCEDGEVCTAAAECCLPDCEGRECGSDGCGGTCGEAPCAMGETCSLEGVCLSPDWIEVAAGGFRMGSQPFEIGRDADERPHDVTLTHSFLILSSEVTQYDFAMVMFYAPAFHPGCGVACPVERVNWHEGAAYANALSALEELPNCYECAGVPPAVTCTPAAAYASPYLCPGYRLPTEAEWEYAARAGTTTATHAGDLDAGHLACATPNPALDDIAWYCGNGGDTTHPFALREPNAWGLYDMLGNVAEWVHDYYGDYPASPPPVPDPYGPAAGTARVIRGGSYATDAQWCRSAFRLPIDPDVGPSFGRYIDLGFRVARTVMAVE